MPRLIQAISRRFRDFACAEVILEVLGQAAGAHWKAGDKNFALFKVNPWHPSLGFSKKGEIYTVEVGRGYRALARERSGH
jgi:hypothetical protein